MRTSLQKRLFITFLLCLSTTVAFAQIDDKIASQGSVYSQFGIGLPVDYGSSSADGLGLWGVSDTESLVPGMANPAHWGSTLYGMGTGGLEIQNYSAEDEFGSATSSLLSVNHFQLQFPLYRGELGVSASFAPYSQMSYETIETGQRVLGNSQDTLRFQTVDVGDGGVNRLELGLGWKINSTISVGYAASLLFASIDNSFTTVFDDNSFNAVNSTFQTSGSGFGNRFGAYITLPSVARQDDQLNIGLAVSLPVKLKGEKVQESTFVTGDPGDGSDVDEELATGEIHIPMRLTGGITYQPSQRLAITTEGRFEQWSNYENNLNQAPESIRFTNRFKIGTGIKYYPYVTGSDKFLSQFKYRLGASYDSGHLETNGQNIETVMLSGGFGIMSPTRISGFRSSVDISFYYGIRGTKTRNLVKENIWGVKLSLNLAELFFFRPKLQ